MEGQAHSFSEFWTRLRRRKVLQWGIAYVAGAWGILQGLLYVGTLFSWPDDIQRFAFIAFALALPVVLVVAWYHGDLGEQRVTVGELAVVTTLFLLGGLIFWSYGQRERSSPTIAQQVSSDTRLVINDPRPSIAVLPLEYRGEPDDDGFVDGIHDDILTQLAKVGSVRVIARASVQRFRGSRLSTLEIAQELGVDKVLQGAVRRQGNRMRVNVQLVDVATDTHLWAEAYDRVLSVENLLAIQADIASSVAHALRASLAHSSNAHTPGTDGLDSWQDYHLARQRMGSRTAAGLVEAQRLLTSVIERDANFAAAHASLAMAIALEAEMYDTGPGLARAEAVAQRAITLDPALGEAWATWGLIAQSRDNDLQLALQRFDRAVELSPNYATARHWRSKVLQHLGWLQKAVEEGERAIALNPLEPIVNIHLATVLETIGRIDDAVLYAQRAVNLDPSSGFSYSVLARITGYGQGRFDRALKAYEQGLEAEPDNPFLLTELALLYEALGERQLARHWTEEALRRAPASSRPHVTAALIELASGRPEQGFMHAQRADAISPTSISRADFLLRQGLLDEARALYFEAYPQFLARDPVVDGQNPWPAISLAFALKGLGETNQAEALLNAVEHIFAQLPRTSDCGMAYAAVHAVRGDSRGAIARLRKESAKGWCYDWWYYRDWEPTFASLRNDPEFRAVFAAIEATMLGRGKALRDSRPLRREEPGRE
jgi:TolB-like protein/Tfp pilus assembly protein PilF